MVRYTLENQLLYIFIRYTKMKLIPTMLQKTKKKKPAMVLLKNLWSSGK